MVSRPIPKNANSVRIIQRSWGIERSYKNNKGVEICTPAPFYPTEKS